MIGCAASELSSPMTSALALISLGYLVLLQVCPAFPYDSYSYMFQVELLTL